MIRWKITDTRPQHTVSFPLNVGGIQQWATLQYAKTMPEVVFNGTGGESTVMQIEWADVGVHYDGRNEGTNSEH